MLADPLGPPAAVVGVGYRHGERNSERERDLV